MGKIFFGFSFGISFSAKGAPGQKYKNFQMVHLASPLNFKSAGNYQEEDIGENIMT